MNEFQAERQSILLGVCGGIAAYKSAEIVRRLQDNDCEVKVVMTQSAEQFIGPLTFQALTGHPTYTSLFDSSTNAMEHIDLARWADKILIAPTSANFMAKLANGIADDLLSTLCLAAQVPTYIAPAMNQAMWQNPATQENLQTLLARNIKVIGPAEGSQACGEIGPGRMLEPAEIVAELQDEKTLQGKTVLITAGPTREALDPVRFISNHSSGKMGYELANQARIAGATVKLISGPTNLAAPKGVEIIRVESALEMHQAVMQAVSTSDIFIACAAVADYRPVAVAENKIKKQADSMQIELQKNPDILADVCAQANRPFCVGFAAETENLIEHARQKLQNKKADLIIANQVGRNADGTSIGFNADSNHAIIVSANDETDLGQLNKALLAKHLIQHIAETYEKRHSS
ncbi:MAG: bifunctional phosphopantothenoylcysteine decarboxylase/phosphopantothenate--cysteine ligase CoaBC [Gammaproteobacteria bacterium]|nr:bifunctional phosphopantothenoylcysteine decarboxylase/phosphopantothenate--cysteine ligase CoaBC [Gammaproteobacteria bacterium]